VALLRQSCGDVQGRGCSVFLDRGMRKRSSAGPW